MIGVPLGIFLGWRSDGGWKARRAQFEARRDAEFLKNQEMREEREMDIIDTVAIYEGTGAWIPQYRPKKPDPAPNFYTPEVD
jgi:hypothetical protein